MAFGQTASTSHHFLRQGKTFAVAFGNRWQAEQGGGWQTQSFTRFGGEAAANDQRNAATRTYLVKQHIALDGETGDFFAIFERLAFIGAQLHHVAHVHLAHIQLDGQGTRVFHGVVKNRGNFAAQTYTAKTLVGHKGNVFAGEPQHAVGGRFAAGTCTHHIAHIGHQMATRTQVFDEFDRAALAVFFGRDAIAFVFQHGQGMQRDVGAAPRIGGR